MFWQFGQYARERGLIKAPPLNLASARFFAFWATMIYCQAANAHPSARGPAHGGGGSAHRPPGADQRALSHRQERRHQPRLLLRPHTAACSQIHSFKALFMRVCQPGPVALKYASTSGARSIVSGDGRDGAYGCNRAMS